MIGPQIKWSYIQTCFLNETGSECLLQMLLRCDNSAPSVGDEEATN